MTPQSKPVAVIGDGWAALASVGFLASSGVDVKWIVCRGARILSPLASLEWGPGVSVLNELALKLGVTCGDLQTGLWIREFRNKAFREPMWAKSPTPEDRLQVRNELLWEPERQVVGVFEARWDLMTPVEIEGEIRKGLVSGRFPHLSRVEGVPVVGFEKNGNDVVAVKLGSGESIECSQVVYADRWSHLPGLEGMPKGMSFLRNREAMGVLQASFTHDFPSGGGAPASSYFAPLFRAPGKDIERHVWGHFSSDGKKSVWTLCLSPEEIEDNHEISKKLRRLKGTLDRMFQGSDLIPPGKLNFGATILEEQVRFEEEAFFTQGKALTEPLTMPEVVGLVILTDGYGSSRAFQQVGEMLGVAGSSKSASVDAENRELKSQALDFVS